MSGEPASRGSREKARIDHFAEQVEAYSRDLGLLPPAEQAARIDEYLALTPDDLDDVKDADLGKMVVDITSFVVRLQQEINRQSAKVVKCRQLITTIVEPALPGYDAYKTEDKRIAATMHEPSASSYYEIEKHCEAFIKRWEYHALRLEAFAKSLHDYRFARK